MVSMFLGFGAVVTGIFGMNLTSHRADYYSWFIGVCIIIAMVFITGNAGLFLYFSRRGIWVS